MKTKNLTIYSDSSDNENNNHINKNNNHINENNNHINENNNHINENNNHINETNYIELIFEKNKYISNSKLDSIKKHIKNNKQKIVELLYKKNIIKNKNIPLKLLMHIYVNYLNNDLELIFL